ncbi:diaminopimelate epimerase [Thermomonas sp. RSS23]|uniref:Diaminopimelate epimerase n=1 Tax=Thermomonas beijingensis TaxID=2872701 RepID=A0ABS7TFP3_9GAMM|nr:diaminopimelate epimerase [Thermomonas beijingensis]MBZ4186674.1 diaminopimelate epimerase [Thermomonas beijingensis]
MRFSKMHGAGNDFVVLDLRSGSAAPSAALCARMADRHIGVGCDQILTIESASHPNVIANYRIWNADGSVSGQCGNGARCVAAWLVRDGAAPAQGSFIIESPAGRHTVEHDGHGGFVIDMGPARFAPAEIPLNGFEASSLYTLHLGAEIVQFGAVSMGNPHAVIEVDDVASADVLRIGPLLQASAAFPQSANIGFAQVLSPTRIRLRVFERGVGETLACGSGACAAVAVLARRGRVQHDAQVAVQLPGGCLQICSDTQADTMRMAGPASFVFEGEWL